MLKLSSAFAAALMTTACVSAEPTLGDTAGMGFEEWKAQLRRDPSSGMYLVDWDILIDETRLHQQWKDEQSGQGLSIKNVNGTDVKWNNTQKLNLTYCVSNAFPNKAVVVNAMKVASDDNWEKFGNVNFVYVPAEDANCNPNNTNVVFDVRPVEAEYLAAAFFPDYPRGQRSVRIDNDAFTYQITIENILIHELGHALGFRHEHIARPNPTCTEDSEYRTLEGYDQVSTMHYPQCGSPGNTLALSAKDKSGIALVYGAPAAPNVSPTASITLPISGQRVANTFRVEAMVVDSNLQKVELFIDGASTPAQTLTSVTANGAAIFEGVTIAQNGDHTLVIKATDTPGLTTQQSVMVRVGPADGGGGGGNPTDPPPTSQPEVIGGCSSGGSSSSLLALGLLGWVFARRRRARR